MKATGWWIWIQENMELFFFSLFDGSKKKAGVCVCVGAGC